MKGEKVSLDVVLESDAENAFIENNDPELNHFFKRLGRMSSYEEAVQSIKHLFKTSETERVFAIVLNDDEKAFGHVGVHEINWKSRHGKMGFILSNEHWNRGDMTDAVRLVVKYSFEMINLRKLFSHVLYLNIASKKVLEKAGFKECGRLTSHFYVHDFGYVNEVIYELFNDNSM